MKTEYKVTAVMEEQPKPTEKSARCPYCGRFLKQDGRFACNFGCYLAYMEARYWKVLATGKQP